MICFSPRGSWWGFRGGVLQYHAKSVFSQSVGANKDRHVGPRTLRLRSGRVERGPPRDDDTKGSRRIEICGEVLEAVVGKDHDDASAGHVAHDSTCRRQGAAT